MTDRLLRNPARRDRHSDGASLKLFVFERHVIMLENKNGLHFAFN